MQAMCTVAIVWASWWLPCYSNDIIKSILKTLAPLLLINAAEAHHHPVTVIALCSCLAPLILFALDHRGVMICQSELNCLDT